LARVLELIEDVLAQVESANWAAAAVAVALHIANVVVRAHAWRNIVAAAYPAERVRKHKIFLAYAAGAGVNAVSPWRGGELLRLSLARRSVSTSTYSGLASTVAAESVFNLFAAGGLLAWAITRGAIPAPRVGVPLEILVGTALLILVAICLGCGNRLREPFVTGFKVFRDPVAYVRRVAAWQALDWMLRLATIYAFMAAFGIGGGLEAVLLIQGAQSASALLPLAPARIGTKQAVLVYVFGSQLSTVSLVAFVAGSEILLAGTNAALGAGALMASVGTVRWRAGLLPIVAPVER
jgi:glycosyltransferase 2 family protein